MRIGNQNRGHSSGEYHTDLTELQRLQSVETGGRGWGPNSRTTPTGTGPEYFGFDESVGPFVFRDDTVLVVCTGPVELRTSVAGGPAESMSGPTAAASFILLVVADDSTGAPEEAFWSAALLRTENRQRFPPVD